MARFPDSYQLKDVKSDAKDPFISLSSATPYLNSKPIRLMPYFKLIETILFSNVSIMRGFIHIDYEEF